MRRLRTRHRLGHVTARILLLALACDTPLSVIAQQPDSPSAPGISIALLDSMRSFPGGLSALPASPPIPRDNPQSVAKIELGKMLFFDSRLSRDGSLSCGTCHDPEKDYSDGRTRALGFGHKPLARRSPSLLNAAYNPLQFWDGRAHSLEQQAGIPILSASEMGMPSGRGVVKRLQKVPEYRARFSQIWGGPANIQRVTWAIAAFERTLITPDSAFDRYVRGDKQALTLQQKRGLIVFFGKGSCSQCHNGPNFTDNKFHSLGRLPGEKQDRDPGRFAISRNPAERGAFKTPSLRNVSDRPPYMHNGSLATVAEVIDWYDRAEVRDKSPISSSL